jgi:hydroxymethylbilane synthase
VPLAGYATLEGEEIFLRGLIGSPDGKQVLRAQRRGRVEEAEQVGQGLALELLERGGGEILATWGAARQGSFVS